MYQTETSAVLKNVGADAELISNNNLNNKMDLLTLVKVSEGRFWPVPKYTPMECSLTELAELEEEEDLCKDYNEEVLVKDFMTTMETKGSGEISGGDDIVGKAKIEATGDTVDGLEQPVSIITKKANIKKLRSKCSGRKIKKENMELLRLKDNDKLTFVYQKVYNSGPVKMIRKSNKGGSISASCQKMLNVLIKGNKKEVTSFTVPENSTFGFGLMELKMDDEKLKITCEPFTHKTGLFGLFSHDAINSKEMLHKVKEELETKDHLLLPLGDLAESTRRDLLKKLSELAEDRDTLSLLEQTLDQCTKGTTEHVQSEAVSSFMDLLDVSNISTAVKDAVHLLVSALDTLPDEVPPLLTRCSPDTLRVLDQLVDGLKAGRAKLPESLPVPLQEGGELRWAAEFICLNDQKLKELSDSWERPELPPEVLLEVLCLAVQGLSLMQPTTNP
ncbi:uncharacterized protein LOC102077861 [Oreochromis niloticus]|uniref:uncharacterized protein LOC102077861 n=1 Tax=Oreochromis niloticus TaxID=8128 RepID=UPI00025FB27E|nr:uncharacterized protein LOC102077861 [Oreochromis niloticus]XP_019216932.1 uncharacterized protein LOC102077861 [Oreochromis niloticus]XP_025764315.1 uncharacterized protein LOC102077861 [Oreochromis niloticus]